MRPPPSLVALVARRILLFAALASVLQVGVVFADYWFDDEELGRIMVEQETERIHAAFLEARLRGRDFPDEALAARYRLNAADRASGYFLRVRAAGGPVLYSNCAGECAEHFLPVELDAPTFWLRVLEPGRPLTIAGGRVFAAEGGGQLVVDFAAIGDPERLVTTVLLHEMTDHMVVPMGLMLFLVIGATILSIRRALQTVALAAGAADRIDPGASSGRLPVVGMPREIARLTEAVNRAFERVGALIRSQKIFAASVAHEIRTPLAILRLELGRIADPRARRAEQNLDALTHTLEQLTSLARLDAIEAGAYVRRDLATLARAAVEGIAPLVYRRGKQIAFEETANPPVATLPGLIETLVRNLVENAVKHTPPGTSIRVTVGPPAILRVEDDGGGFATEDGSVQVELGAVKTSGALGLGLKIVERIAVLHGAELSIQSRPGVGLTIAVSFPRAAP